MNSGSFNRSARDAAIDLSPCLIVFDLHNMTLSKRVLPPVYPKQHKYTAQSKHTNTWSVQTASLSMCSLSSQSDAWTIRFLQNLFFFFVMVKQAACSQIIPVFKSGMWWLCVRILGSVALKRFAGISHVFSRQIVLCLRSQEVLLPAHSGAALSSEWQVRFKIEVCIIGLSGAVCLYCVNITDQR